ncbi:MAG: pitrilysin family protein [Ignavibacteria bacterium]|nr:pitrilysin family protein [Ignavibacteria bacterium]
MKSLILIRLVFVILISFLTLNINAQNKTFSFPKYEKVLLPNGITLYLLENNKVPLITVSTLIKAGSVNDGSLSGLAFLTNESILFGTKSFSKSTIEESFEQIGSSINVTGELEFSTIRFTLMKDKLDSVLPILKEVISSATFPKEEVEKRKQRLIAELKQYKERPKSVIGYYFNKFVYGDQPYGNPVLGSSSTIEKISDKEIKDFYLNFYTPSNTVIAVSGDFKSAEMKSKIISLFSDWTSNSSSVKVELKDAEINNSRVLLINKEDANETMFYIGGRGVPMNHPDYTAIQVVNTILGGRFTSWLNDELRVNSGLTYGANSAFRSYSKSGLFIISSFTQTTTTFEAIDLALEVIDRLHTKGVDEKTLQSAKNYIKGQFPPRFETNSYLASFLSEMAVYGYDENYVNSFEKNVDQLTTDKVKEVISKYFPKNNLQFVLIGKASELREKATKYGKVFEKDIKSDGY